MEDERYSYYGSREGLYSQLGQDEWVLSVTDHKTNGYFVEAGATDGVHLSNTYLMESKYGWNGICCEPNSDFHPSLTANRSCHIDSGLLYDSSGETETLYKADVLGGTLEDFKAETERMDERFGIMANGTEEVTTITLNDLLDKYDAPEVIDYISLDTEGSELRILTAFDFSVRDVRLWTVEHNAMHRPDGDEYLGSLIHLMGSQGYHASVVDFDVWFYRDDFLGNK
tara:strand:+ start:396 stop:1076 length:681 start_codon:yes stop_codon:yes gene_type:complete